MPPDKFEQNIKILAKQAARITGDESDAHDAEKILRCFDSQTIDLIKTFTECCEKIGKKIEDL